MENHRENLLISGRGNPVQVISPLRHGGGVGGGGEGIDEILYWASLDPIDIKLLKRKAVYIYTPSKQIAALFCAIKKIDVGGLRQISLSPHTLHLMKFGLHNLY